MPLSSTPTGDVDLALGVHAVQARHHDGSVLGVLQSAGMSKSAAKALPLVELAHVAITALAKARHQSFEAALYSLLSDELAEACRPKSNEELVRQADAQRAATRAAHEKAAQAQGLMLQRLRARQVADGPEPLTAHLSVGVSDPDPSTRTTSAGLRQDRHCVALSRLARSDGCGREYKPV